jgi:hypothetical protein
MSRLLALWWKLPAPERSLVVEAMFYLLWSRLVFAVLPFAAALKILGCHPGEKPNGKLANDEALAIALAIERCARHVPFRAVCLQQAFAGLLMLRRRGLAGTVHFGVRRGSDSALAAHAWSLSGTVPVTGYPLADDFVRIAVFSA